jgi:hypothetical protein
MGPKLLSSSLAAGCVFSLMVSARAPAQQNSPPPYASPTETSDQQRDTTTPQSVTVIGCILNESSVLKRGPLGTATMGGGSGDKFVLIQAAIAESTTATEKPEAGAAAKPGEPVGTSGSDVNFGKVYRLTGNQESDLKNYVGKRVEIVGTIKNANDANAENGAVGTTGTAPASELTAANTPELSIASVTPSTGSCSAPAIR